MRIRPCLAVALVSAVVNVFAAPPAAKDKPWLPKPVPTGSWLRKHAELCRVANSAPHRVFFIGDSLTECWQTQGRAVWLLDFHEFTTANLGISADRVEHIHYRIANGLFRNARPALAVLMAGTNNLAAEPPDSPKDVVRGIQAAVLAIQRQSPRTKVVVLSILPNGHDPADPLRKSIDAANKLLKNTSWPEAVAFLDIQSRFLNQDGKWIEGATIDGTHLTEKGYEIWARAMRGTLEKVSPVRKQ